MSDEVKNFEELAKTVVIDDEQCLCCSANSMPELDIDNISPGQVIDNWRILQPLAEGGMGRLFICHPLDDPQSRAVIKFLRQVCDTPMARKRFLREYKLQTQMQHPSFTKSLDARFDDKVTYIVSEYIEGKNLAEMLALNYDFSPEYTLYMFQVLASAFQYAWKLFQLLHRDIKPSNIMVTPEGEVKILDFGIAKSMNCADSLITVCGKAMGSPGYMSPEACVNAKECTCLSDIFSLGATMYHVISGKPPFPGKSFVDVYEQMKYGTIAPLTNCNQELAQLVMEMLAIDAAERPEGWDDVIARLDTITL